MGTESPSNQKTQEELFEEIIAAKAEGKDYGRAVKATEIVDEPEDDPISTQPVEEEPETPEPTEEDGENEGETPAEGEEQSDPPAPPAEWDADLPEDVRAKIKALKDERDQLDHRVKSDLGRVPFLQRKIEELSRQLSEPRTPPIPEPAATKTSPTASKFAEQLARAREVDPALADLLEAMREEIVNPLREELTNEVNQTKALFVGKQEEEKWHSEKAKLLSMVPQADEIFKLPLYRQWKEEIPENLRRLAGSIHADEVVIALEQFAKYAAQVHPELVTPAAPSPAAPAAPSAAADKVAQDRARKLNSPAPSGANVAPRAGGGVPEDPEALFKYLTDKIRKNEPYKV